MRLADIFEERLPAPEGLTIQYVPGVKLKQKMKQLFGLRPPTKRKLWSSVFAFEDLGTMADREYWVAIVGRTVVGYISYFHRTDENRFSQKYIKVNEKYRNSGIANDLINASFKDILDRSDQPQIFVNGFSALGDRYIKKLMLKWKAAFPNRFLVVED